MTPEPPPVRRHLGYKRYEKPMGARAPLEGEAVNAQRKDSVSWYVRAFSLLLLIWGAVGLVSGIAILYAAFADSAAAGAPLSLSAALLGLVEAVVTGLTIAVGIVGLRASRHPRYAASLRTLAVAGIVSTVLGLGLCNAVGNDLPTSLLFNGLLMVICLVIAGNLARQSDPAGSLDA